jgi:hypothetical protein
MNGTLIGTVQDLRKEHLVQDGAVREAAFRQRYIAGIVRARKMRLVIQNETHLRQSLGAVFKAAGVS